jgi:hypothetical protein
MAKGERGLLEVLRAELKFLEQGGYRQTARAAWRPHFMFEDSPTCLNFDSTQPAKPCIDCVLMQAIPQSVRTRKIPCRYIPLNDDGETIDSFYRTGTQEELEAAMVTWLKTTIERLERENAQRLSTDEKTELREKAKSSPAE